MSLSDVSFWFGDGIDLMILFDEVLPISSFFGVVPLTFEVQRGGSVWRLYDPTAGTYEEAMIDCTVQDAYSRFARRATVTLSDPSGTLAARYPRKTPLQIYAAETELAVPALRFGGYVDDIKTDAGTTVLELLSFDFWLRARKVYSVITMETISAVLQNLVEAYTPLEWDAGLVSVQNDIEITRTWKGDALDAVLAELSSMSAGEEWGATDEGKFFFRPQATRRSPRDFVEGEWSAADFDEDSRAEINKVTIYYGEPPSTGAVSLQDRVSQKHLQERFGSPRPVVIEAVKTYPEIATEEAARAKAAQILADRQVIRTGTLETWGALAVRPGDVCRVEVEDQQVDEDYRVAQIEYSWSEERTVVTLAENSDGVVDVLVELSDEVSRIDARAADTDAPVLEVIQIDEPIGVEVDIAVYVREVPEDAFLLGANRAGLGAAGKLGDQRGDRVRVV